MSPVPMSKPNASPVRQAATIAPQLYSVSPRAGVSFLNPHCSVTMPLFLRLVDILALCDVLLNSSCSLFLSKGVYIYQWEHVQVASSKDAVLPEEHALKKCCVTDFLTASSPAFSSKRIVGTTRNFPHLAPSSLYSSSLADFFAALFPNRASFSRIKMMGPAL